ncbi:hypothetical protein HYPSUDRAFT_53099 [Hypholoma sublateritium FD-334 SS-4]|uniref:Tyrosinase copper-binding domain-containing protein n=1 Tax=Hypholoma sublateritium (strain FD-334 SS-4) TaxID=945553 RepID=A0A0D2Q202_HYPSF|nr:hypothetical protein HYPSUDRAFT_53099 [Hypholoma sublateritium FD-334 SS-4]
MPRRTLDDEQKADYISAVLCLQSKPAKEYIYSEVKTRFDEFQAYHIQQTRYIHTVSTGSARDNFYLGTGILCSNTKTLLETNADPGHTIHESPVFDPATGFGGTGVPGTYTLPTDISPEELIFPEVYHGCVQDGPFANLTLHLGPGEHKTTHCLVRGIGNENSIFLNSTAVANATKSTTFEVFRVQLEGRPATLEARMHDGGHVAVGGDMSNIFSAPGGGQGISRSNATCDQKRRLLDPLFFLHHANLDRIWWNWQQVDPSRLYDISGRSSQTPPFVNVTLDYPLEMAQSIGPTVPLWKVMDIRSEYNCYTYV